METYQLILFFFLLLIVSAVGLSVAGAHNDIRALKYRLDRWDISKSKSFINLEAAAKDEEIKNLNGDIAKLKFDYACEVAGRNEGKTKYLRLTEWKAEKVEIDGVPHLKVMIRKPYRTEPSPVIIPIDSDLTMDKERLLALEIKPAPLRGEWVDELSDAQYKKPLEIEVTCGACNGEGLTNVGVKGGKSSIINCPECDGEGSVKA